MKYRFLLLTLVLLAGCRGTQKYTRTDLDQVREAYATIPPIYQNFKAAYYKGDATAIQREFRREQHACRLVDVIDKRDTIDPNINLFAVSAGLDTLCNDIEAAYAGWAMAHHLPYDKSIEPGRPQDVFIDGDASLEKMPKQMQHPSSFA